jgi:predicted nucleic acid-binding protein
VRLLIESSAVLTWLLDEARGAEINTFLLNAELVLTSNLTWIECDRVLHRYAALEQGPNIDTSQIRERFEEIQVLWTSLDLSVECQQRARRSFPVEPVRTLDALHLATAMLAAEWVPNLRLLSLDIRLRENAVALGLEVLPPQPG